MITTIDKNDITEIRQGQGELNLNKRHKITLGRPMSTPAPPEKQSHNQVFRLSTWIKNAPEPRKLYGIDDPDSRMTAQAIMQRLAQKQYPMYSLNMGTDGIPQYDSRGNLLYMVDPQTGKRIVKQYSFDETLRDTNRMSQLISRIRNRLPNDPEAHHEAHLIGLQLMNAMSRTRRREQFDAYYNVFLQLPRDFSTDDLIGAHQGTLSAIDGTSPDDVRPPIPVANVSVDIIRRSPVFHRYVAHLLANNAAAFSQYLSRWIVLV